MNKKQCRRCVVLFATILCLTAVANAQRTDKKGKKEPPPFAVAFVFKGIVEQLDANAKWVTVTNENIPGWLNYKKMTYKVDNPEVLKTVKPGDRVTAKVYEGDFKVLYELTVVPPEDTPVFFPKKLPQN
jgi:Cu/Ag efflux protein CusF